MRVWSLLLLVQAQGFVLWAQAWVAITVSRLISGKPSKNVALSGFSVLPFTNEQSVPELIICDPDIAKPDFLKHVDF